MLFSMFHHKISVKIYPLFVDFGKENLLIKYFTLCAFLFIFSVFTQNAYAVNSIDWTYGGSVISNSSPPFSGFLTYQGNFILDSSSPLTVQVDASDEGDFATNGIIDTINVTVSSAEEPNETITLSETGQNTGIFTGTRFLILEGNYRFQPTDTINLIYTMDPTFFDCASDNLVTQIDSRSGGSGNGFTIYSETDTNGVGIVLTETGENTCVFTGKVKFTTTGETNENTGTLKVSPGDFLLFYDDFLNHFHNAQILPVIPGKESIFANIDDPDEDNTAEIIATYGGLTAGLDLDNDQIGGGFGGPVKPGLVLNFISFLLGGGNNPSEPPTLGLDQNQKRIVEGGFSFNGNPVDVEQFFTHYPLITTPVGQNNTIKLKIYEDKGIDNIAHVGISYGLSKGETFNEGRATIEYDKTFDGKESITLFDPKHVLGVVNVTNTTTKCSTQINAQCLEITFAHIFREPLEYNMVATNIWDFDRNGWQNYFNHGIQIVGNSMNPPDEYSGIYKGRIYHLSETGKNAAIDDEGNSWTFDKAWNRDYIKPVNVDSDILNQPKINAIEQLGFNYSDGQKIFGFNRVDHRFTETKITQEIEAQKIMGDICSECQKIPFEKINNIFFYDIPHRYSTLDPKTESQLVVEDQKAQEFLKHYFEKIYPGRIDD